MVKKILTQFFLFKPICRLILLTHSISLVSLQTRDFLMFSQGIEWNQWYEMGYNEMGYEMTRIFHSSFQSLKKYFQGF